jgi:ankyrin repeat protein
VDNWDILEAVEQKDLQRVKAVLEADASLVKAYDPHSGRTPLHCAAISGPDEIAEYLLTHGADVNAKTVSGFTPLMAAVVNRKAKLTTLLVTKGAEVKAVDREHGASVLHMAAAGGDPTIIEFLLSKGADVECRENDGWTPLHTAAYKGHLAVVKALIAGGARVDAKAFDGTTPLRAAELGYQKDVVEYLRTVLDHSAPIKGGKIERRWWRFWK